MNRLSHAVVPAAKRMLLDGCPGGHLPYGPAEVQYQKQYGDFTALHRTLFTIIRKDFSPNKNVYRAPLTPTRQPDKCPDRLKGRAGSLDVPAR